MNINELSLNDIHNWPKPIKIAIIAGVFFIVLFAGYWFDLSNQSTKLEQAIAQETTLKQQFESRHQQLLKLEQYTKQIGTMKSQFGSMLKLLTGRAQIPSVLDDISKIGIKNGLTFKLFKPLQEKKSTFYYKLPINVTIIGTYHQFATFTSDIANLNRLVVLKNFAITPIEDEQGKPASEHKGKLLIKLSIYLYRYAEEKA